jgi:2-keto-4-pentenoate hydratase
MSAESLHDLRLLLGARGARRPYGWKVALNKAAVQRRLGLTHALAAPLEGPRVLRSGERLCAEGAQLHVEAELGLTLAAEVREPLPLSELRSLVQTYTPCLEIVDYALPASGLSTMLGHAFFHAGVVLGEPVSAAEFRGLSAPHPEVTSGGRAVRARAPGQVPEDVVVALQAFAEWVIAAGGYLGPGELVLCGSYIEPVPLPRGASLQVHFGAPFADVCVERS